MLAKKDLKSGNYYVGSHRNTDMAMWDGKKEEFLYIRSKFGDHFLDTAKHPEDDDGHALFVPFEEVSRILTDEECSEAGRIEGNSAEENRNGK